MHFHFNEHYAVCSKLDRELFIHRSKCTHAEQTGHTHPTPPQKLCAATKRRALKADRNEQLELNRLGITQSHIVHISRTAIVLMCETCGGRWSTGEGVGWRRVAVPKTSKQTAYGNCLVQHRPRYINMHNHIGSCRQCYATVSRTCMCVCVCVALACWRVGGG